MIKRQLNINNYNNNDLVFVSMCMFACLKDSTVEITDLENGIRKWHKPDSNIHRHESTKAQHEPQLHISDI